MGIAILSAGPSLAERWCDDRAAEYRLVIAVNAAGLRQTRGGGFLYADWHAFADRVIIEKLMSDPPQHDRSMMTRVGLRLPESWRERDKVFFSAFEEPSSGNMSSAEAADAATNCCFTMPCALAEAVKMANFGERIDCYGLDADGAADVAGLEGRRDPQRWLWELPWVRRFWDERCRCMGAAPEQVVSYLHGELPWKEARRIYADQLQRKRGA